MQTLFPGLFVCLKSRWKICCLLNKRSEKRLLFLFIIVLLIFLLMDFMINNWFHTLDITQVVKSVHLEYIWKKNWQITFFKAELIYRINRTKQIKIKQSNRRKLASFVNYLASTHTDIVNKKWTLFPKAATSSQTRTSKKFQCIVVCFVGLLWLT